MEDEERSLAKCLLDADSTLAKQKVALQRLSEILEECYILNLPASRETLSSLESFSKRPKADTSLKAKAKRIHKKYSL